MDTTFEEAMRDPAEVFAHPNDVLASNFSDAQKRKILLNWEDQMIQRQTATSEGMSKDLRRPPPGEQLQEVSTALEALSSE